MIPMQHHMSLHLITTLHLRLPLCQVDKMVTMDMVSVGAEVTEAEAEAALTMETGLGIRIRGILTTITGSSTRSNRTASRRIRINPWGRRRNAKPTRLA